MSRKHPAPLLALSTSQAGKFMPLGQGEGTIGYELQLVSHLH